jgi:ElaA protein
LKVRQEVFIVEQTCYYLDADGYDDKALHIWADKWRNSSLLQNFFSRNKYPETSIRVLTNTKYRNLKLGKP